MSWKAAKALCILPSHYPQPPLARAPLTPSINATTATYVNIATHHRLEKRVSNCV